MNTQTQLPLNKMVFRNTHAHSGRRVSVTPENSTNQHLAYGRVILNPSTPTVSFSNGDRETGFIVLSGEATISTGGETFDLARYDSIYIPRDSSIAVSTQTTADIAEFSADVANRYPLQIVRFADISKDSTQVFTAGAGSAACRHLHMCLAKNIQAGRLVAG